MELSKFGVTGNVVSARAQAAVNQLFDKIDDKFIGSPIVSFDPNFGLTFEWVDSGGGTMIARFFQNGDSELFHLHRKNGFHRFDLTEEIFIKALEIE